MPDQKKNQDADNEITYVDWNGGRMNIDQLDDYLENQVIGGSFGINAGSNDYTRSFNALTNTIGGIFGMPYQFSEYVDIPINTSRTTDPNTKNPYLSTVGRKFSEKIMSIMPVLFLTPGEPVFMDGYGKKAKTQIASQLLRSGDDTDNGADVDDGRYYSFNSNFVEYKKYANVALRALAKFMGIGNVEVPVPGKAGKFITLKNIDVESFMNSDFTKLFGTNCVVPFFLDAESAISEDFSNDTTESMIAQTANGFSQTAREVQFLMGSSKSNQNSILNSIGNAATDVAGNILNALGDVGEAFAGKTVLSRLTNELTTIVSGGKIVFPEIWSDSGYSKQYSINLKLRSPDPDPVSIFLNIYMPIILLVSMAAPRQIKNSSTAYEAPFLVRATYKSIFSCDLGIISSLSISKGGEDKWNVMGQPMVADVSITLKDLYSSMFISKRMGLIHNTAQLDYLSTMAGIDLNDYEPLRIVKLYAQILGDTPRDIAADMWGGIKQTLNRTASKILSTFSDTRFLQ